MRDFLIDYFKFVQEHKAYWLIPLILFLMAIGSLLIFAQGSALAPFIYTLF